MTTKHMENIYLESVKALICRPALLRSESFKDYSHMLNRLAFELHIKDPMEWILLDDIVHETFVIKRLRNASAHAINRRLETSKEISKRHDKDEGIREFHEFSQEYVKEALQDESTRSSGVMHLNEPIHDEIVRAPQRAAELKEATALENNIDYQIKLTQLTDAAYKRRNTALEQLDWYRATFAQTVREASDAVIIAQDNQDNSSATDVPLIQSKN